MRKFRFITKEEYLTNVSSYQVFYYEMGNLFGNEIDITKASVSEEEFLYSFDNNFANDFRYKDNFGKIWSINMKSVVEITKLKEEINMERIYKEDWEELYVDKHIIGVEMQNSNKYYLVPNEEGFVPVNLKEHIDCGYSDTTDLETGIRQCSILDGNKKVFEFKSMQEMVAWATS